MADSIRLGRDPPSLLLKQLVANGFAIIDNPVNFITLEGIDLLSEWFQLPLALKQTAAAATTAAHHSLAGRGFFSLLDKEVLEVKQQLEIQGLQSFLQLIVHEVYTGLQKTAASVLQALFASDADSGLHATEQQLQSWLSEPATESSGSSSVLHASSYKSCSAGAPHVLGGSEAHVDRGLLTLVADSGPGLEVLAQDGSWVPVSPSAHQLVVLVGHTLHWATAGRLPAAKHRIVTAAPGSSSSSSGAPRLSLAFKLRAAAGAQFDPAAITGTPSSKLASRYRAPKRTHELLAAFDAVHLSIHNSRVEQPLPQQQQQQQLVSKRHCTVNAATAQLGSPRVLRIILQNQLDERVGFKVKDNIRMAKVFAAYAARTQTTNAGRRLLWDGQTVRLDATPEQLGIEDGEVLDVLKEQLGD